MNQMTLMTIRQHQIEITWTCEGKEPLKGEMSCWANAALNDVMGNAVEISLKVVSIGEMTQLNHQYRGKDKATNVLSFPADTNCEVMTEEGLPLLGDIAICLDLVKTEAKDQEKSLSEHFAHLLIHGILHLAGYDHEEDEEALIMEGKETQILSTLGIKAPYENGSR